MESLSKQVRRVDQLSQGIDQIERRLAQQQRESPACQSIDKYLASACSPQPQLSLAWAMPRRSQTQESSQRGSDWYRAKAAQVVECGNGHQQT